MLILVATPIGNLRDLSARAEETLRNVDLIAAEDTRVTGGLLHKMGIGTKMISYHEHNAERMRPLLLKELRQGKKVALVSDAGTPLISDPGYKLVQAALTADIPVTGIPGPSAPLLALILSGLPCDRFFFGGFLPSRKGERKNILEKYRDIPSTLVFFETPKRLADSLRDCAEVLGNRACAVARELTKLHEEILRGDLLPLAENIAAAPELKGEIVLVIAPPLPPAFPSDAEIRARLALHLKDCAPSQAAARVAREFGIERRFVYSLLLDKEDKN